MLYSTVKEVDDSMEKKKRVVAYARVSTKKAEQETSLRTQEIYYKNYIESHEDWEFAGIYSDSASGTKLTRKGFSEMLLKCGILVEDNGETFSVNLLNVPSEIDLIVVKSTSRFARSDAAAELIAKLKKKNVYVFFESMQKSTESIEDKLLTDIMFVMDRNYSVNLSKNARISYIRAVEERGTIYSNPVLFGYVKEGKGDKAKLVPESQAHIDIINKIFHWYIEGKGFRVIAKLVDDAGFKSKKLRADGTYAPIGKHGIRRILTNERYCGYIQVPIRSGNESIGKIERTEDNYRLLRNENIVPIVDEALFKEANKTLQTKPLTIKNKGKKGHSAKYSKYLVCADCGVRFIKAAGYKGKDLYVCSRKRNEGAAVCSMPYLSEQFLDEQIKELCKGVAIEDDRARKRSLIQKFENYKYGFIWDLFHTDNADKIKELSTQHRDLAEQLSAMLRLAGKVDEDHLVREANKLSAEMDSIQDSLDMYKNEQELIMQQIAYCDGVIKDIEEIPLPDCYTEDNLLAHTSFISSCRLPNTTNRVQSKTNHVELELVTNISEIFLVKSAQFEDGLKIFPDYSSGYAYGFDDATKAELLSKYKELL